MRKIGAPPGYSHTYGRIQVSREVARRDLALTQHLLSLKHSSRAQVTGRPATPRRHPPAPFSLTSPCTTTYPPHSTTCHLSQLPGPSARASPPGGRLCTWNTAKQSTDLVRLSGRARPPLHSEQSDTLTTTACISWLYCTSDATETLHELTVFLRKLLQIV